MTGLLRMERHDSVHVLHLNHGENLVHLAFLEALHGALDKIEAQPGPAALVITGHSKYYSTGFDRSALADSERAADIVERAIQLCKRLLALPLPSCAAINGHAFGIGAMIALSLDFRVMREDRGYLCFPELDLGFPLHPGMYALLKLRIDPTTLHELILLGTRVGGTRAHSLRMVDEAVPGGEVLPRAIARVQDLARHRGELLGTYKRNLNAAAIDVIEAPTRFRFPPVPYRATGTSLP